MRAPSVTIKKRQGQNQYYEEPIVSGVRPLEMMQIPSGTFLMGSPEDELERRSTEGPQHRVKVPLFFMAKYPVTQTQWQAVATMLKVERELHADPSAFKGADRPVERVTWDDAVEFCARLSIHTGRPYRLPSEAEWEYACRADTATPFHFGETVTTDLANYRGQDHKIDNTEYSGSYGSGPKGEYREETTPSDYFGVANAFGLCDMHGNVWEWCQDIWHQSYEGAPTDGSAWIIDGNDSYRIQRGGSWYSTPETCRSARRSFDPSVYHASFIGFRVVSAPPGSLP